MSSILGIDVSSNNDNSSSAINWQSVANSGQAFAWTKVTEGTNYTNPDLLHNWAGMKAAGLVRGAYHFARPDNNTPEAEAAVFLAALHQAGGITPGDLLALDLEAGSGNLLDWALRWLRYVEQQVGFKPMLYSGTWFLGPHGCLGSAELGQYGLWLSGYQANMPAVPADWAMIAMWQYTDQASVPGVPSLVDQSYFLGSRDELLQYGMPGANPVSPSPLTKQVADTLVTVLSVIGDNTYPDGSNMDEQATGQPAGVSKRVFVRELVQQAKALLGA